MQPGCWPNLLSCGLINRYSKYWQEQFDMLAVALQEIEDDGPRKRKARKPAP
jgi:hypothetical protein